MWRREIKGVTKALGDARDADVQIDFLKRWAGEERDAEYLPGIERLLLRLNQHRERLQAPMQKANSTRSLPVGS